MESLTDERGVEQSLWGELRGMLLFSSLTHVLILGILGTFLYHYSWMSLKKRMPNKYPVISVNLVNFLESPLISQPKLIPNLPGLRKPEGKSGLPTFLKPIFKPSGYRKANDLPVISEEPKEPIAIRKQVAYPAILKPARGGKPKADIFPYYTSYPPKPRRTMAQNAITGLNPGEERPIHPALTKATNLTAGIKIASLGKETLATAETYMDIPESLKVKPYQERSISKDRHHRIADLFGIEDLGSPQISHPVIPPAPDPSPFFRGKGEIDPSLIKGGFATLNTQDPNLIPYMGQVRERVLGFWRYPMEIEPGLKGVVQLVFTVERDGSVSRIELLKSSGYPPLDKGAMQALSRSSPFSPLPQESKVTHLSIAGTFKYNMD